MTFHLFIVSSAVQIYEFSYIHYHEDNNDGIFELNLWLHFKESNKLREDARSALFRYHGIISQPSFAIVSQMDKQQDKHSAFFFLRKQLPSGVTNLSCGQQPAPEARSANMEITNYVVAVSVKGD